jgi:hypothetical protein
MTDYTYKKTNSYRYRIMLGPYRYYNFALEHQMNLLNYGMGAEIEKQGNNYVICLGNFRNLEAAAIFEKHLRIKGYHTIIIIV